MKVYIQPNELGSRALVRVTEALYEYRPKRVKVVERKEEADLVVLHVIGRRDAVEREASKIHERGKKYAVIQYALKSTMQPTAIAWLPIWHRAEVVWSYYDLYDALLEDGLVKLKERLNFYSSPLGVDPRIFKPYKVASSGRFTITTTGRSWLTESVRECVKAAQRVGGKAIHIGADLGERGEGFKSWTNITDVILAQTYSNSDFVSGLRRIEGFELPAAEGLLCGARPILFDRDHYRRWYGDWAEYVEEGPREQVIDSLEALFRKGARPVSKKEITAAKKRFDWNTIIAGFWERAL